MHTDVNNQCDFSQLSDDPISFENLLETAFSPDTPDKYSAYLQSVLNRTRERAARVGWEMESFSFMLNRKTGIVTVWG